ncbi:MAG: prolyl oligopeptidase family protein [Planctomycetota bacterium]
MTRLFPSSALACLLLAAPALAGDAAAPPGTPREPVTEDLHGEKLSDPYRWLEGDAEGNVTERVAAWTDAQNAHTRAVLDALPGRKQVEARLAELMQLGWVGAPTMRGRLLFNRERKGDQNQAPLYVREGPDGAPRLLLDPNTLDAKGLISLDWYAPSLDGARVAFGTSHAGDENTTLRVLETASGRWLADELPNKIDFIDWLPDGSGFFYSRLRELKDPYSRQIRFHRLGAHPRHDQTLYEQHSTTWGPFFTISPDARWGLLGYFTSTRTNDLWVVDLDRWFRTGEFVRVPILEGADASAFGVIEGDTLFLRTSLDAPNGKIVAVDLHRPERARWKTLIEPRPDVTITELDVARGLLVLTTLHKASTRIERYALDGEALGPLTLPGIGSASVSLNRDRTEGYLTFTSFNEPSSIYRVDVRADTRALWARPEVPVDPALVEVRQVVYESKDKTPVTMFLVHKKGLKLDGDNPTLLYGYGGFNISMTPSFSATLFPWLEAGGVYALPNLRGGGEYGDAWHKAGTLGEKQHVFDDFIGAAEWLIANKVTRPARLAISGGSNGGLLTGAVVVQRPDLFRAVISAVPLLDMLRYQRFLMARFWVPEYGTAENKADFAWLRAYSPYQNVKEGVPYPAVFLTAGENDSRVHPLHARKMAAALQHATTSPPAERPVLLWVDRDAGHGQGKPLSLRIRDLADVRMFLRWQLGMLPPAGSGQ